MKAHLTLLAVALPVLLVQACASYRPAEDVTAQMARTEAILQQADRSGVAVNSLPELQAAKDKYAEAKRSLAKESQDGDRMALQLAKQAEVDAQYATAKAQNTSQQGAAREVQNGTQALKEEANRNATTPPAASP
jgi:predicted amidohydrolase